MNGTYFERGDDNLSEYYRIIWFTNFLNNEKCFQKIISFNMEFLSNKYHFIVLIIIFKMIYNISDFLISELKYPAEKCTQQLRELWENCTKTHY